MKLKNVLGASLALAAAPAFADPSVVVAPGSAGGGYVAMARLPIEAMRKEGNRWTSLAHSLLSRLWS